VKPDAAKPDVGWLGAVMQGAAKLAVARQGAAKPDAGWLDAVMQGAAKLAVARQGAG